jgi:ribonuclease HII
LLNDSKKLTEKQRHLLRSVIEENAISYAVAFVYQEEIDRINILNASIHAMHLAIEKLKIKPEYILVDGNRFSPFKKIPYKCIIRGDGKYQNIAAASILAKTYRDEYMEKIGQSFPEYKWNNNKGYPTHKHRAAIKKYGPTQHHRKSFKLLPNQTNIIFK